MIQPASNINHSAELISKDSYRLQSCSDDLLLVVNGFFASQDLANFARVDKRFQKIVQKFYKHTDSLRKLISTSSHILGDPATFESSKRIKSFTNNDQFIAYITNNSLKLLDVVQGKIYSYESSTERRDSFLQSKIFHVFSNQLAYITEVDRKVYYITLKDSLNLENDDSLDFPERGYSWASQYSSVDSSGRFAIVEPREQSIERDGFIDIINIETKAISRIEDQEARSLRPSCVTIHQDLIYIGYMNWNALARGGYANSFDLIKVYSLLTKEVLQSYTCSFPKQILIGNHHLVVSQDAISIQIFDKQNGTLIHAIDPGIDKGISICGYICSLSLYEDKIIAGLQDNRIKIWSIQTGELLKTIDLNLIEAHPSLYAKVSSVAKGWKMDNFIINEHYLAIIKNSVEHLNSNTGIKNKIFIFDTRNYCPVYAFEAIDTITSLKFTQNQLLALLKNGQVQAWDSRWKENRTINEPNTTPTISNERPSEVPTSMNISPSANEQAFVPTASNPLVNTRRFSNIQNWYKKLAATINTIINIFFRFVDKLRQLIR